MGQYTLDDAQGRPGVGAAGYAMSRLSELGLVEPIRAFPRPLLGVCLGQQLLFETSQEGEGVDLLGFIPGAVSRLEPAGALPVPHMGWSRLRRDRDDPLLEGVADGAYAYFVHGYVCPDGAATLARADYGGAVPAHELEVHAAPGNAALNLGGRDVPPDGDPVDYTTFSLMRILKRRQARVMI